MWKRWRNSVFKARWRLMVAKALNLCNLNICYDVLLIWCYDGKLHYYACYYFPCASYKHNFFKNGMNLQSLAKCILYYYRVQCFINISHNWRDWWIKHIGKFYANNGEIPQGLHWNSLFTYLNHEGYHYNPIHRASSTECSTSKLMELLKHMHHYQLHA